MTSRRQTVNKERERIEPAKISHSNTTFKGVTPGPKAHCTGSLLLEVIFGSPDNFRSEKLTFDIAPFRSGYQALLGRMAFARFNAIPHYAYLKLKMPGARDIITVSRMFLTCGRTCGGFSSRTPNALSNQNIWSVFKTADTARRVRRITSCNSLDIPEIGLLIIFP